MGGGRFWVWVMEWNGFQARRFGQINHGMIGHEGEHNDHLEDPTEQDGARDDE